MNLILLISLAVVTFILLYVLIAYIQLRTKYKPIYEWWDEKYADSSGYTDFFSLTNFLYAFENVFLWRITDIGIPPVFRLDLDIVYFIMYDLMQYKSFIDKDGVPQGCLTPRSLCQTIIPAVGYGDDAYDNWYNSKPQYSDPTTAGGQLYGYNESVDLVYTDPPEFYQSGDKEGDNPATPGKLKSGSFKRALQTCGNNEKCVGVYPAPSDTTGWATLILEWLNGGQVLGKWYIAYGTDNIKHFRLVDDSDSSGAYDSWYKSTQYSDSVSAPHPANFFARMAIEPDSPLILYFIANQYSVDGVITDPVAFSRLTNSMPGRPGGWLGYVLGKGHNVSANELSNYIRTTVQYNQIPPVSCPTSDNGVLRKTTSFMQGFLPMAAMALFPGVGWEAAGLMVAGGAILGGLGVANDSKTPKC
jgi:hypothetical protein